MDTIQVREEMKQEKEKEILEKGKMSHLLHFTTAGGMLLTSVSKASFKLLETVTIFVIVDLAM